MPQMTMRRTILTAAACAVAAAAPAVAHEAEQVPASADLPLAGSATAELPSPIRHAMGLRPTSAELLAQDAPGRLRQLGHTPLGNRGMNAALAVQKTEGGTFAYVGSRTDATQAGAGVQVVDVTDPTKPTVLRTIRTPALGESSRELRVLPEQDLLLVLNHGCSELIHRCANGSTASRNLPTSNVEVYDVAGANAAAPKLVSTYFPSRNAAQQPHEFFLWTDPEDRKRVLLFGSTPASNEATTQMVVTDLSRAREGKFTEFATFQTRIGSPLDDRLHSFTISPDGRRAYLAYLGGGFLVADTSQVAEGVPDPKITLITDVAKRPFWTNPGAHSAIKLPGRDVVMTTDEVYGKVPGLLNDHGCPWGWPRFIDISDPVDPEVVSEYKLPVNEAASCAGVDPVRNTLSSFSSHNPTLTRNLAFLTWHSAGLQVIDTSDPARPKAAAQFVPQPLPAVQTEDPLLSSGQDKVVMWSFPVIVDGLVYVVDLRNGLYVLDYDGPHEKEVEKVRFLDGNSNSGDAARLEEG